ncbi:class I SAM-dependent methyltransferase [bacterium]|nr:class I SAM-dependent methyltransferase [bacterium]
MPATQRDTGLGTTYERVAVARLLAGLADRYTISRVLEGPTDGITGISGLNSVPLARAGASVDLVLGDPDEVALAERAWEVLGLSDRVAIRVADGDSLGVEPRSHDLVWNFNSLPQVASADALLDEMCEASSRFVMVFVSNTWNYGFPIHRLHHKVAREPWSHGDISVMNTRAVAGKLADRGFKVVERLLVDTPWWPDIDSPIEEVAATFLPFLKRFVSGSKRLERYTWTIDTLPYFDDERLARLLPDIEKHFAIENTRVRPLKIFFAHHRGVLARRMGEGEATA